MSEVFVLDTKKQPLNPVHSGQARRLLSQEKSAIVHRAPSWIQVSVGEDR